jgi:hypothetical protein
MMRARVTCCVALTLACVAIAHGQEPSGAAFEPSKKNVARLRWLQYSMVTGRIVAASTYPNGTKIVFGPTFVARSRQERLRIDIGPTINLQYELADPAEQLVILLAESKQLSIHRTRFEPKYAVRFEQNPGQPLLFEVVEGDVQQTVRAESFWHLVLAEPKRVRRHLIPLLEILHPAWQLAAMGDAVEAAMVQRGQNPRPFDGPRWARLVDALGSPKFAERQNAQRELVNAGQAVLPYLQKLDRDRLDAEQASRVRALIDALSVDYEDTTDRIATWLADDAQAWLSLLARDELAKRRVATEHLGALLGAPINFDPAADQDVRDAQIERLHARFEKPPRDDQQPSPPDDSGLLRPLGRERRVADR